ncbi:TPA: M42 family metallopeptidase [Staphylococcus aureus]|nr:M42 family metallopeptidase [Staphylococcus aureus]HDG4405769.1 M42 family metallopeptidase [Staphylococcus aureus]
MNQSVKLLKHLTDVNGVAGYEMQVKEAMRNYIEPVSDQIIEDNLGGIFGKKNAENGQYSIMISGHMDEVGFMVTKIDKHGFISFTPVGGWWNQVMLSQKVTITTDSGKEIRGIIGSKPPHVLTPEERKKPMEIKNMFIDIGVSSKGEAEEAGVEVGNMVTPYSEFEVLANNKYLTAKAFDNRYGCALAIEVLQRLKDENIGINLYSGATVQEEVGLRKHIKDVAKKHNIEVQWDTTPGGGTDAGSIHVANEGIPTMTIGVTLRYMHSNVSVLNVDDYENSIRLVTEIVRSLNDETYKNIMW